MAFASKFDLRLYENRSFTEPSFSGLVERDFQALSGSRLVITFTVTSVTGTLNIGIGNDFQAEGSFDNLTTLAITTPGNYKKVVTDFHSLFKLKLNVGGGSAAVLIGLTLQDNSGSLNIDNAEIEVDLDAATDSVTAIIKDEDGDALQIEPDGSINVNADIVFPPGLATEATLASVLAAVDQLESYTDAIEGLITSGNALLTSIRDNTDTLEVNTDDLETLITASNALLTSIRDNADTVEALLTSINGNVDGLETLVTATNALLTTIRDNADTVETLLTNILAELDAGQYTMNEAFSKATAIAGQLDDTATTAATENNVAPVRITEQRALHTNLRDNAGVELGTAGNPVRVDPTGTTLQPVNNISTSGTGTITALNGAVTFSTSGKASAVFNLTGTWVATLYVEGTVDGTNWFLLNGTLSTPTYVITSNIPFAVNVAGLLQVRIRAQAFTSGTVAVAWSAGVGSHTLWAHNFDLGSFKAAIGGQMDDAATTLATEDSNAVARITAQRALHVNLRTNAGLEIGADTSIPALSDPGLNVRPIPYEPETFMVPAIATALGNGKSMISIVNAAGSPVLIKIRRIWIVNQRTTAVTGVVTDFRFRRNTGHSAGTDLTANIQELDTNNTLNANVTVRTGATIAGAFAAHLRRYQASSDEWGPGTADVESAAHSDQELRPIYDASLNAQPITLRAGQGFDILCNTNTTAGTFDITLEFTQETP